MPVQTILNDFRAEVGQCDNLIANAHQQDANGNFVLPPIDRQQITVAAFLNMFIGWETFIERTLYDFMTGEPTIGGAAPVKYVSPLDVTAAQKMIIAGMTYFDFGNHDRVVKIVRIYFENGYPYEPHLSGINSDLADIRTMRNASAHISSTTQKALEALATAIFGQPQPGITLSRLLTAVDPRSAAGNTVFVGYRDKLTVTAELIANG